MKERNWTRCRTWKSALFFSLYPGFLDQRSIGPLFNRLSMPSTNGAFITTTSIHATLSETRKGSLVSSISGMEGRAPTRSVPMIGRSGGRAKVYLRLVDSVYRLQLGVLGTASQYTIHSDEVECHGFLFVRYCGFVFPCRLSKCRLVAHTNTIKKCRRVQNG
jgi:hypothetical protein